MSKFTKAISRNAVGIISSVALLLGVAGFVALAYFLTPLAGLGVAALALIVFGVLLNPEIAIAFAGLLRLFKSTKVK